MAYHTGGQRAGQATGEAFVKWDQKSLKMSKSNNFYEKTIIYGNVARWMLDWAGHGHGWAGTSDFRIGGNYFSERGGRKDVLNLTVNLELNLKPQGLGDG